MGMRHCLGALSAGNITELFVADINQVALDNAKSQLEKNNSGKAISFYLWDDLQGQSISVDVAIVAATAGNRIETCEKLLAFKPKCFLVEKPLGQSMEQVLELIRFFEKHNDVKAYVNLNTRLYSGYQKIKKDLKELPQFKGELTFSISTGTIGIGANGIHYIDLLKYLTGADTIEVEHASIDDTIIASGRGPQFADFGGYAVLNYLDKSSKKLARAFLILHSTSTVLGPWEIVGNHGRILIDEFEQTRFNKYRKADSELPLQRYAGDYLPMETEKFEIPFLNELTAEWLNQLAKGNPILPEIKDTLVVHEAMFAWLSHSKSYKKEFPIT